MTTPSLRLVRILSATIALGALAACGGGSETTTPPPPPTSGPTDIAVTVTAPTSTVVPGKTATWSVVLTNGGQWPTTSTTISNTVDPASTISAVRCKASGTAHCPQLLGASMTMGQLPPGESLSFDVDVIVAAGTNGTVYESASVSAPNDTTLDNNTQTATATVQSYDVGVSVVPAGPTIPAGLPTIFTATIANSGPAVATNLKISDTYDVPPFKTPLGTITCVAAGGATCPADPISLPVIVPTLPVGGTLTLAIEANVVASARGTGTFTVAVQDDNDSSQANNTSTATTQVVDARNGSYQLYASNAEIYTMTVDFDALTYGVVGNGVDASGTLTLTPQGTYAISSNQEIRASAPDLLVGAFDFGAGPQAFIAARSFATSVDDIGTAPFTVFGISADHVGTATSTIESQAFDASGTMTNCTSVSQIFRLSACPDSSRSSFALSFSGADITGVDSVSSDTIHLRVAKSGDTRIALRAETDATCDCTRFSVGVTDNLLALSGKFAGASSIGSTGSLTLTDKSYGAAWLSSSGVASTDTATLGVQGTSAPVGLRGGVRASDGSFIYVVENAPIALVVGAFDGPANGTMEIWSQ